jgi:hypothetical protein
VVWKFSKWFRLKMAICRQKLQKRLLLAQSLIVAERVPIIKQEDGAVIE